MYIHTLLSFLLHVELIEMGGESRFIDYDWKFLPNCTTDDELLINDGAWRCIICCEGWQIGVIRQNLTRCDTFYESDVMHLRLLLSAWDERRRSSSIHGSTSNLLDLNLLDVEEDFCHRPSRDGWAHGTAWLNRFLHIFLQNMHACWLLHSSSSTVHTPKSMRMYV